MLIELGISMQPFQESFDEYGGLVTWSWMASLWEKCSKFKIKVVVNDTGLEWPRERDRWLLREFIRLGYKGTDLTQLNRVRLHQQVSFLSDIVNASGGELDERYLKKRPRNERWSVIDFPKENPAASDFRLWAVAIRRVVPTGGLSDVRLGRMLHSGYKLWEWRVNRTEQYLLHYTKGKMDVYEPASASRRRWQCVVSDCEPEVLGLPCSVRNQDGSTVTVVASAEPPVPEERPRTICEVLGEWGVTDGSYIKEITREACSSGFVLECTAGRGRIIGSFPEQSKDACAYRGELLGLLAIHLVLLAANKLEPQLQGSVEIVSDCLGALSRVSNLPDDRLPSGCKHSDILKVIMTQCNYTFTCKYEHVDAHQDEKKPYILS
eukprot:scaffold10809_cov23-Cyclotella_meneghiniana.AAC.4